MLKALQHMSKRAKLFVLVTLGVTIADQLSKYWAVAALTTLFNPVDGVRPSFGEKLSLFLSHSHPKRSDMIEIVEDFWHFRYVENPGAAWGFLADVPGWFRTPFFLLVSLMAMVFIVLYFQKSAPEQKILRVALALVLGGAIGNFIDRARLTYVIDFIDWHWYRDFTWPTFNIADAGISVGVGLLILDMFLYKPDDVKESVESQS
jgi:signal peptidase II